MHNCTTIGALGNLPRIYFGKIMTRTTLLYSRRLLARLRSSSLRKKLEELKKATNDAGTQRLRGLMREHEKWSRAYDDGGWRYEFQTSNMPKSFDNILKGIRAMPVNAIISFTFYRLVAWFNERYSQAMALQSKNQLWAPKPLHHLDKAKDRAHTHEVECFDHAMGEYEVMERGVTTSDGEVLPSRSYIVILINFSCTCGRTRQYHFPCCHYIAAARHHNFAYESRKDTTEVQC
jgi:hypothetical protein